MRVMIEFRVPTWTKWFVGIGAACIAFGAGAIKVAEAGSVPNQFESGKMLTAKELNDNFTALQDAVNLAAPPATVVAFAGSKAPNGWLLCDGSAVSRTQYAALFAAITVTYGVGNSVDTFNLPDLRASTIRGVGTSTKFLSNTKIELGQVVNDQAQGHTHVDQGHAHGNGATDMGGLVPKGDFYGGFTNVSNTAVGYANLGSPTADGTNGTPRTGAETTGKALGMNYIIKY